MGGLPYDQLGVTGFGVAEATEAATQYVGMTLRNARVAIQGFGAVGQAAAARLVELGASIVAVSTAVGAVHDPEGLDVGRLSRLRDEFGDECVREYGGMCEAETALTAPCDILIPAAREDTITVEVARETTARLIVEGANLPTSPASRIILAERNVHVIPDFIANAGGIVAAAHSTAARNSPFVVDPADIFSMISRKLRDNTHAVLDYSARHGVTSHEAAWNSGSVRLTVDLAWRILS